MVDYPAIFKSTSKVVREKSYVHHKVCLEWPISRVPRVKMVNSRRTKNSTWHEVHFCPNLIRDPTFHPHVLEGMFLALSGAIFVFSAVNTFSSNTEKVLVKQKYLTPAASNIKHMFSICL